MSSLSPITTGNFKMPKNTGLTQLANNRRFGLKTNPAIQSRMPVSADNNQAADSLQQRRNAMQEKSAGIVQDGSRANQYVQQAVQKRAELQAQADEQRRLSEFRNQQQQQMQGFRQQASQLAQNNYSSGQQYQPAGNTSNLRNQIVSRAHDYLGTPYVWGGKTPRGFDCSGLTKYVYRQFGINLPSWSNHQTAFGTRSHISNARPGDLVGWNRGGHVAIYIGNGRILHSPRPGSRVSIRNLSPGEGVYAVRLNMPGD